MKTSKRTSFNWAKRVLNEASVVLFGYSKWKHLQCSDNCLSLDNFTFASAHVCVCIDRSESSTSVLQSANGKVVTVDCNPAMLVLGAATNNGASISL